MKYFPIFLILLTLSLNAQELPSVIPPAPNAAEFEKYVETPVSYVTGIPQISIPIYQIEEGEIKLPVDLSYHAGGIKVEEIASWVGLGWSLNSGGIVTRTMQGLPDDNGAGYMYTTYTVANLRNMNFSSSAFTDELNMSLDGGRDYQPDIFSYNFMGYSGKFMYDQVNHVFIETPYSNNKITPLIGSNGKEIVGWIFTTPDGMKFYFGKSKDNLRTGRDQNTSSSTFTYSNHEYSIPSSGASIPNYTSSWYLMDIESPTHKQIKFYYSMQPFVNQFNKTSESYNYTFANCTSDGYSASFAQTAVDQTVIQKIEFSNGRIEFEEDTSGRLDLSGSKALKTIKIYQGNSLLKKFNLAYDYTISAVETGRWTSLGDANQRRYRLRLLSVQEENSTAGTLPPFSFQYSNIALPSRFSNAQDYWGYYNAKTSNPSLIPEIKIPFSPPLYTGEANRTVDPVNSKAGVLTRVIYPTGGSAEYFYETNTASLIYSDVSTDYDLRNRLTNHYLYFLKVPANVDNSINYDYSMPFTIGSNTVGDVDFTTMVTGCDNSGSLANLACDYIIKIVGVSDPNFQATITSSNASYSLPAGNYKITASSGGGFDGGGGLPGDPGGGSSSTDFSVLIQWWDDPHPAYLNVGGLRVNKIVLNDDNGATIEKTYSYDKFGQNLTSGYIVSSPIFKEGSFYNGSCVPGQNTYNVTSYSQAPATFVKGNILAYENVTEYRSDNVKTEYTFSKYGKYGQYNSYTSGDVHLPDVYVDWIRGNMLKKEEFKIYSGSYYPVSTELNEYERVSTVQMANVGMVAEKEIGGINQSVFDFGFYSGISEYYRLKKKTQTNYFNAGNNVVVQDIYYENNPLLPSKTITSASDGDPIITKNYYPEDVTSTSSLGEALTTTEKTAIDRLKSTDLYRIAEPVQISNYKDYNNNNVPDATEIVDIQRTNYKDWGNNIVMPEFIQTTKGMYNGVINPLMDRIQYHSYYTNGNVQEVSKKDGTHIVYIWGYHERFPIAKIENATYSEVSSQVANLQSLSDADDSVANENSLRTALNNLRNTSALSDALVTTLTYDPLVGVTSITDPMGQTLYYHYDSFYRLKYITDKDGKVVSKNEYHYKNQ